MSAPSSFTKLRYRKTRIGGRELMIRIGRTVFEIRAAWTIPWEQYVKDGPVFAKLHRNKYGWRLGLRVLRPYMRLDINRYPRSFFNIQS